MTDKEVRDSIINILMKDLLMASFNKNLKETIVNELKGRVSKLNSIRMFNDNSIIEMFNDAELYFILKVFYNMYEDEKYDPKKYFTDVEINKFNNEPLIEENNKYKFIEIHNIDQIQDDLYFCNKININEIIKVVESGYLIFDPRVQRPLNITKDGEQCGTIVCLNKKLINETSEKIIENTYFLNAITWNIMKYEDEREKEFFQYDNKKRTLKIELNSKFLLQIIDGWYMSMGMVLANQKKPNLSDRFIQLRITHYTMNKVNNFIDQEIKVNKLTTHKQSRLKDTEENIITRQLNTYGTTDTNLLCGRIGMKEELHVHKLISFKSLAYLIKNNFELKKGDLKIRGSIVEYLIEFFNITLSLQRDKFNFKNTNIIINQNILCALTCIAGLIYKEADWKSKLFRFLDSFNWESKEFQNYSSLGLSYGKFKELGRILIDKFNELVEKDVI